MNTDLILSRLQKVRPTKQSAPGEHYVACCPAHDDRNPSMLVTFRDDRVLFHCRAGCGGADIAAAIGLSPSDLFDKPPVHLRHGLAPKKLRPKEAEAELERYASLRNRRMLTPDELADERKCWLQVHS